MTVNTPTTPVTTATSAPTARAMCTGFAFEEAGREDRPMRKWLTTMDPGPGEGDARGPSSSVSSPAPATISTRP